MTLTGLRPVKVIMRLTAGPKDQPSIAWPFGPCSEPGPSGQANSAPSGPHKPKYRGPKGRSTQKSGPSGLDFWVRLAFGQAQNKNQRVRFERSENRLHNLAFGQIMLYRNMAFGHIALNSLPSAARNKSKKMRARGQLTRSNLHSKYYVNGPRISQKGRRQLFYC